MLLLSASVWDLQFLSYTTVSRWLYVYASMWVLNEVHSKRQTFQNNNIAYVFCFTKRGKKNRRKIVIKTPTLSAEYQPVNDWMEHNRLFAFVIETPKKIPAYRS